MQRPIGSQTLATLQIVGAVGAVVAAVALWVAADQFGDRFYLIRHEPPAYWLTLPQLESRAKAIPVSREAPPRFRFEKRVEFRVAPEHAPVRVRGLRELSLSVNGEPVPLDRDPKHWKRASEVDLAPFLHAGENLLTADLRHREGPPLLLIESPTLPVLATTGKGWRVTRSGRPGQLAAVVADDVREYPGRDELPSPRSVLSRRVIPLGLVFLVFAAPVALGLRAPRWVGGANLPRTALVAVAVFWAALFASKGLQLPNFAGFDSGGHLGYVKVLAEEGRFPRADEGWEAFHPPLYYALGAGLRRLSGATPDTPLDRGLLRLLPMLAGLAAAGLAGRTARRLAPDAPALAATATLAAGLLPMHVLLSTFVSNESVHTLFASAALLVTCELLCVATARPRALAALSIFLGLALLTKSTTSVPLALLLPAVVALKLWLVEARPALRAAGTFTALVGGVLVLSGWFYLRNWMVFGDPFVSNLTAFQDWAYWIPPGFHTPAWFMGFGESLSYPFFASFHSFADGFYSSFWGDGYASGSAAVKYPNPWWDYDSMVAIYPLALPATGILAFGFARGAVLSLRGEDVGRRLALSTLWLVAFGMSFMLVLATLRIPFNAMPKAFYTLPALVPVAVAFAFGVEGLGRIGSEAGRRWMRSALAGYGGVLGVSIALAFLR